MSKCNKTVVFVQRGDFKSKIMLEDVSKQYIVKYLDSSPILFPFFIMPSVLRLLLQRKRWVFIFRYLNDYPSIVKTLLRALSESFVILISKVLNGRIFWICHNVDRESARYHPKISLLRRRMLNINSSQVYVMHKHLIKYYKNHFRRENIDYLSFGYKKSSIKTDENILSLLLKLKSKAKKVCWSAGKYAVKTTYIDKTVALAKANPDICFVMVIADLPEAKYIQLKDIDNIFIFKGPLLLNEDEISHYIDFFWRSYNDLSVPYSVFSAVKNKKKILCMKEGFLSELIFKYDIGVVLEDICNIPPHILLPIEDDSVQKFEVENNWEISKDKLLNSIYEVS